jgi:hypothetical protein
MTTIEQLPTEHSDEDLSDDELTAAALAADPDAIVGDDAVDFWEHIGMAPKRTVGDWYMATPVGGTRLLRGWHRHVALVVIVAFLAIDAYGLCNTYGWVAFG